MTTATSPASGASSAAALQSASPLVKICGIRNLEVARAAVDAGADLLGFNFAPISKRRIDVSLAHVAIQALRCRPQQPPFADPAPPFCRPDRSEGPVSSPALRAIPAAVGIFVNQPLDEVAAIADRCSLDYIQLSGDEDPAYCVAVAQLSGRPVIKAVRLTSPSDSERVEVYPGEGRVHMLLADAAVAGSWGGSGAAWDWSSAASLARRHPLLLAGGLTPTNVANAIAAVGPLGVDVASGVETDGHTDPDKVRHFIKTAKSSPVVAPFSTQWQRRVARPPDGQQG